MQQHVAEQVAQLDYHNITAKADMSGNVGVDMAQVLTALNGAHEPIAHTHVVRVELDGLEFALEVQAVDDAGARAIGERAYPYYTHRGMRVKGI